MLCGNALDPAVYPVLMQGVRAQIVFIDPPYNVPSVQLGRFGRNRSNVWHYPVVNSFSKSSDEGNLLALHPTVKPVALVADAIMDCTSRRDNENGRRKKITKQEAIVKQIVNKAASGDHRSIQLLLLKQTPLVEASLASSRSATVGGVSLESDLNLLRDAIRVLRDLKVPAVMDLPDRDFRALLGRALGPRIRNVAFKGSVCCRRLSRIANARGLFVSRWR